MNSKPEICQAILEKHLDGTQELCGKPIPSDRLKFGAKTCCREHAKVLRVCYKQDYDADYIPSWRLVKSLDKLELNRREALKAATMVGASSALLSPADHVDDQKAQIQTELKRLRSLLNNGPVNYPAVKRGADALQRRLVKGEWRFNSRDKQRLSILCQELALAGGAVLDSSLVILQLEGHASRIKQYYRTHNDPFESVRFQIIEAVICANRVDFNYSHGVGGASMKPPIGMMQGVDHVLTAAKKRPNLQHEATLLLIALHGLQSRFLAFEGESDSTVARYHKTDLKRLLEESDLGDIERAEGYLHLAEGYYHQPEKHRLNEAVKYLTIAESSCPQIAPFLSTLRHKVHLSLGQGARQKAQNLIDEFVSRWRRENRVAAHLHQLQVWEHRDDLRSGWQDVVASDVRTSPYTRVLFREDVSTNMFM